MSYADVAAKGPKQTNAEVRSPITQSKVPDAVPEIAHSDSGVHSLDSLSGTSPHISSVSSYADQQLAAERAEEAERDGKRAADKAAQQAKEFTQQAERELSRLEKETGKKYDQWSAEAKSSYEKWKKEGGKEYEKAKREAGKEYEKAKKEVKEDGQWVEKNRRNPVVVGNAVAMTAVAGLLGIGAYRLHRAGELTWKVAGTWAGIVGLFAVGDYYVSQYFFKKYPPKQ